MLQKLPIGKKLTAVIFLSNIIVLLMVFSITGIWNLNTIKDSNIESAKSTVEFFSQDFIKIMIYDSPHIAADTVSRLQATPFIKNVVLYNLNKSPVFHYSAKGVKRINPPVAESETVWFKDDYLHIFSNLIYEDKVYGSIYYRMSTDLLDSTRKNYMVSIAALLLLVLFISLFISYRFQKIFSQPIVHLAQLLGKVTQEKDLTFRANTSEKNEIGKLYNDFNKMVEHIDRQQKELQEKNKQLILHRDHLQSQVNERTRELSEYTKELEAFSYSVSHDLRTPLRSINGFSTMLLEDYAEKLDDSGRDLLTRIINSSNRMGELIDDLLQLSRINQHEISKNTVNISEIFSNVLKDMVGESWDCDDKFDINIQPNIKVIADPNLMRIAIENLVSNSIKYSSQKSLLFLEISCDCSKETTTICIRDGGIGFEMKFAEKLFKPFERLHSSEHYEGTGIGLATVKRIIERHGGKIWAEGELNVGATFFIQLPEVSCQVGI